MGWPGPPAGPGSPPPYAASFIIRMVPPARRNPQSCEWTHARAHLSARAARIASHADMDDGDDTARFRAAIFRANFPAASGDRPNHAASLAAKDFVMSYLHRLIGWSGHGPRLDRLGAATIVGSQAKESTMKAKRNRMFNVVILGHGVPYVDNASPLNEADADEHARELREDGFSVMVREAWRIW